MKTQGGDPCACTMDERPDYEVKGEAGYRPRFTQWK
jgi:hypothetical protein